MNMAQGCELFVAADRGWRKALVGTATGSIDPKRLGPLLLGLSSTAKRNAVIPYGDTPFAAGMDAPARPTVTRTADGPAGSSRRARRALDRSAPIGDRAVRRRRLAGELGSRRSDGGAGCRAHGAGR